jgi:hypothetical protein
VGYEQALLTSVSVISIDAKRPHSQLGYLTPLAFKAAWFEAQAKLQDS